MATLLSIDNQYTVYGLARSKECNSSRVTYYSCDLNDPKLNDILPSQIDACIHTAAVMSVPRTTKEHEEIISANVVGTARLCNVLHERKCRKLIYCSTIFVYQPGLDHPCTEESCCSPNSAYGLSKLYAEYVVKSSGLGFVVVRLPSLLDCRGLSRKHQPLLYEWRDNALKGNSITVFGHGQWIRPYLLAEDVGEFLISQLDSPVKGIYNIGPTEKITIADWALRIATDFGSPELVQYKSTAPSQSVQFVDSTKANRDLGYVALPVMERFITSLKTV